MTSALDQLISVDDLDLDLVQSTSSVQVHELVREFVDLDPEDISALKADGPEHSLPGIKHIRAYHHIIALRLACGDRPSVIAASLGIGPPTISKLQKDKQFQDLVENYRGELVEKAIDHTELMSAVSFEALSALHERLTGDERDEIPLEALRRIAETTLDRHGHSPVRRSESINRHEHSVSRETIERVKNLHSEDAQYRKTVDITPAPAASPVSEDHPRLEAGTLEIEVPSREIETHVAPAARDNVSE